MRRRNTTMLSLIVLLGAMSSAHATLQDSVLDNGTIRIGVDIHRGGVITYLSKSGSAYNVVNSCDLGREIQQSYYSGPKCFQKGYWFGSPWPWNPIGTGDCHNNPSELLEVTNNGKTIYVKSIPKQWALDNVPGDCVFETWIVPQNAAPNAIWVRCRLTNHRSDTNQYPAELQELPAVYTIGDLHHLYTYDGEAPFSGGSLREIQCGAAVPDWKRLNASENWAALVDDKSWGLGVFSPGCNHFWGGFCGTPGGGPSDSSTGYIAPRHMEILDHNIVYTYDYYLIMGTLSDIRDFVYQHKPDNRPDYCFESDRRHWWYVNTEDTGWPIAGKLKVRLDRPDVQIVSPVGMWAARDFPRLYVRAAFYGTQRQADIRWKSLGDDVFTKGKSISFEVIPDGEFRTYEIDVSTSPFWTDSITNLSLEPRADQPGAYVDIAYFGVYPK
ncbi:MAG: hypothetical protein ACYC64_10800 [Armatimonadota bacterium]